MKTSELSGAALDWAVAKCEGFGDSPRFMEIFMYQQSRGMGYCYSTDWAKGGPIIEREEICVGTSHIAPWMACLDDGMEVRNRERGDTLLIAAMRCYVASKLGDEVELPEELEVTA
jgi:hypothetical protein